jgi:hypothetical protein
MPRSSNWIVAGALAPLLLVLPAGAQEPPPEIPQLTAEYAADYVIEGQGMATSGRLYAAPGKERREMTGPSGPLVIILRHDRRLVWTLMPAYRSYTEAVAPPATEAMSDLRLTAEGEEQIEGVSAVKYRLPPAATGGAGDEQAGFVWLTANGIPMRIESRLPHGARTVAVSVTLRNLHVGPLDPNLFEVPPDYRKVALAPPPPSGVAQ